MLADTAVPAVNKEKPLSGRPSAHWQGVEVPDKPWAKARALDAEALLKVVYGRVPHSALARLNGSYIPGIASRSFFGGLVLAAVEPELLPVQ